MFSIVSRQVVERIMGAQMREAGRTAPRCKHFGVCGGCWMQDIPYPTQVRAKGAMVAELVHGSEGLEDVEVRPAMGMDHPWEYRNKAEMTFGASADGAVLGFAPRRKFYEVVEIAECPISSDRMVAVGRAVQEFARSCGLPAYDCRTHEGLLRHLVVREGKNSGGLLVNLVAASPDWPREEFAAAMEPFHPSGVVWTLNTQVSQAVRFDGLEVLSGSEKLEERALGCAFHFSPQCFFQTNTAMAELMFDAVVRAASSGGTGQVLDAYCGVGTLAILVAGKSESVAGVESVEQAVDDARLNAVENGVDNVYFICRKMEKYDWEPRRFHIALLDPPRAGCHTSLIRRLLDGMPEKIVYVSCNPVTLAADIARLRERYRVEWVQPIDMFPHTAHVEAVALLKLR